jgi:hypothetical protein
MDNGRVNRYIMTMTLAEFFVIVQICVFSSLATTTFVKMILILIVSLFK